MPFPQKTSTPPPPEAAFPALPAGRPYCPLPQARIQDRANGVKDKEIGSIETFAFLMIF